MTNNYTCSKIKTAKEAVKVSVKKLPDGEFEIMNAVWHSQEPVTSPELTRQLQKLLPQRDWKAQTVLTMLVRLEKKGFLRSEKINKERSYYAVISQQEYLKIEQESFRKRFSDRSFSGLVKALYSGGDVSDKDIEELRDWINKI